jgi:capsular polysaccharide biosynthesis protein
VTGVLLALFSEMRDPTIHDSDELGRYLAIPLMAAIPTIRKEVPKKRSSLISLFAEGK